MQKEGGKSIVNWKGGNERLLDRGLEKGFVNEIGQRTYTCIRIYCTSVSSKPECKCREKTSHTQAHTHKLNNYDVHKEDIRETTKKHVTQITKKLYKKK